ncbi:hypothetical protein [Sinomonas gamaensis]|jgi:hypothetical protein|uniref:hypothetical protein n=1 Tax=Sinomonas gamaensis TaxID=2565624 RepID=UPI001108EDA6|nr:hypothetical protein [Sinomonas gamaensis]
MTFESNSVTVKIWDRETAHHTLEAAVAHISRSANAPRDRVKVIRTGPNIFTVGIGEEMA